MYTFRHDFEHRKQYLSTFKWHIFFSRMQVLKKIFAVATLKF